MRPSLSLRLTWQIWDQVSVATLVIAGQTAYESGLRDRSSDSEQSLKLTSIAASGAPLGCQWAVGLLYVRLLAEATVSALRNERVACLGTSSVANLAHTPSKSIDFRTVTLAVKRRTCGDWWETRHHGRSGRRRTPGCRPS